MPVELALSCELFVDAVVGGTVTPAPGYALTIRAGSAVSVGAVIEPLVMAKGPNGPPADPGMFE